jgi:hypothetical protein
MEILIYVLYAFLIIVGAISIIGSLTAINTHKGSEANSSLETKWFKWQAPIRLVFGLLCIMAVILLVKMDYFKVDQEKTHSLENNVEALTKENIFLRSHANESDTTKHLYYFLTINDNSGVSVLQGRVLISNSLTSLKFRGCSIYTENKSAIQNREMRVNTGDKLFLLSNGVLWGINIIQADINSHIVKLELYRDLK